MEKEAIANLSPPWYSQQRKLDALLGPDPDIDVRDLVETIDDNFVCSVKVNNGAKAAALKELLIDRYVFGGCEVMVSVEGAEGAAPPDGLEALFETALDGNPLFEEFVSVPKGVFEVAYCVLAKKVIQFWNDDLSDLYGNYSCLPTEIARSIFKDTFAVQYCVSNKD